MNQQRHEGTLKKWNAERGFGFILADCDGHDIFVHATAFPDDGYLPTVGEVLTFDIEPDRSGKRSAVRVQRFIDPVPEGAKNGGWRKKLRLSKSPSASASHSPSRRGQKVVVLVLLAALAVLAYSRYAKRVGQIEAAAHSTVP
nr:cold shock domain-containing protein [Rhodoferax sp.]